MIAGGFLRHGGSAEQKAAYIPGIIDGSKTFAFAQLEKNSRYDLYDVSTTAKKKGSGWVLDGEKFVVLNGESADVLVVTARTSAASATATASACSWCLPMPRALLKRAILPGQPACRRYLLHRRRGRR